jgi:hypothetical protein
MKYLVVLTALVGLLAAAPANAGPILGTLTPSPGPGNVILNETGDTISLGWSFTTGPSAVRVSALDAFFLNGQTSAGVRLYDASAATLASATVTTSDPTETNGLTWNSHLITPITLSANTTYYIAEDIALHSEAYIQTTTPTMGLGMTYGGGVSAFLSTNPTSDQLFSGAYEPSFFGPNFDATAVATAAPEPASLTLLGLGVAGLAGYGWRRHPPKA